MCTQFCIELPEKTPLQIILNFFLHIFLSFFLNFLSNFFNHILFISHSQVTIHPITNRGGCGHVNCITLRLPPFKSSFYYIKKKKDSFSLFPNSQPHNSYTSNLTRLRYIYVYAHNTFYGSIAAVKMEVW